MLVSQDCKKSVWRPPLQFLDYSLIPGNPDGYPIFKILRHCRGKGVSDYATRFPELKGPAPEQSSCRRQYLPKLILYRRFLENRKRLGGGMISRGCEEH